MSSPYGRELPREPPTVVGLLDGLIDQGVHIAGDLVIGLADVDLIRIALRLLVASEDTAQRTGVRAGEVGTSPRIRTAHLDGGEVRVDRTGTRPKPTSRRQQPPGEAPASLPHVTSSNFVPSPPINAEERDRLVRGVSQLVLTVVELIRELIERQAVRRVETGNLTTDQVERLGVALQALEERMEDIKDVFGVTDEDLNLDLGPLGRLW